MEFAVFEVDKLKTIPYRDGLVLYQHDSLPLKNVDLKLGFKPSVDLSYAFEECVSNLHVGLLRLQRGEILAAQTMIQRYAFDHLMTLLLANKSLSDMDAFNFTRRFELLNPSMVNLISSLQTGYFHVLETAKIILDELKSLKRTHPFYPLLENQLHSLKETSYDSN